MARWPTARQQEIQMWQPNGAMYILPSASQRTGLLRARTTLSKYYYPATTTIPSNTMSPICLVVINAIAKQATMLRWAIVFSTQTHGAQQQPWLKWSNKAKSQESSQSSMPNYPNLPLGQTRNIWVQVKQMPSSKASQKTLSPPLSRNTISAQKKQHAPSWELIQQDCLLSMQP